MTADHGVQSPICPSFVVANPSALRFDAGAWRVFQADLEAERGPCVFYCSPDAAAARAAMLAACARACGSLVVVGGDGSVQLALEARDGRPIPIELVPIGTANDLACEVASRSSHAVRGPWRPTLGQRPWRILPGRHHLDLLTVNGRPFSTTAALGIPSDVVAVVHGLRAHARLRPVLRAVGRWVYPAASLQQLALQKWQLSGPLSFAAHLHYLDADGVEQQLLAEPCAIFFSNRATLGGTLQVSPTSRSDDGLLEITLVTATTPALLLRVLGAMVLGLAPPQGTLRVVRVRAAQLQLQVARTLLADGEALETSRDFVFGVQPGALQVGR